ncbi:MAG TPA: hypothetical protein VGU02_03965 [Gaiellaceae bacterium]|nr:hypothetical protein [Gaiellaceae bacterium]
MFTLVNHHRLREPIPAAAYEALSGRFDEMRELGLQTLQVISVADDHVILIAVFESGDAADRVSELIGSPWLREHVIPRLSSPTEQSFGEALCSLGF